MERARLPSADELFRQTGPRPEQPVDEPATVDAALFSELQQAAADEDAAMAAARQRATRPDLPSPAAGALLGWATAVVSARHVVEVGASAGLTGLWLMRGMTRGGMLTTIESDGEEHARAQQAFAKAGVADRVRGILGDPDEVLPRLSDGAYEMVLLNRVTAAHGGLRGHALRLLRPGGLLVVLDLAAAGLPQDARVRRAFVRELADDEEFRSVVLPIDRGILLAHRTGEP